MHHVGIDLGGRESQICVRLENTEIIEELRVPTKVLHSNFGEWPKSCVVMETCSEAFALADRAKEAGHVVKVVPATLVRALGVGARGIKTDRKDAQALSLASCRVELQSVHVRSLQSRQLQSQLAMRRNLVNSRTMLINGMRGWMRTILLRAKTGIPATFHTRVREALEQQEADIPTAVQRQLNLIETLSREIAQADKELKQLAQEHHIASLLMTVPGVGPVTSLHFVATVDDINRFRNAHGVESYIGLTPGQRSSGDKVRMRGVTKAGSSETRRALVQAAWCLLRTQPKSSIAQWGTNIALRRGKFIAAVAVARKLAGILFAMWKHQRPYEPTRAAKSLALPTAKANAV
jgi:transposase